MKRIIKFITLLLIDCLGLGFLVSAFEDKKGWTPDHTPYGIYEKHIKRPLDFGLALFALILLWPLMLVLALLVRIKLGSPVIFTQERPGLGGEIFKIKKFRTMTDERGSDGSLLPDEERLTAFGKFLRSTSLDELPELLNIVSGDMSIIGPRPLLVRYLDRYSEEQKHRHDVRPGLTSLSASKERNLATWDHKFKDDVTYANNITFVGDLKILVDTVRIVAGRKGISSETSATMEEFMGND